LIGGRVSALYILLLLVQKTIETRGFESLGVGGLVQLFELLETLHFFYFFISLKKIIRKKLFPVLDVCLLENNKKLKNNALPTTITA
jgi:hypothetical protein